MHFFILFLGIVKRRVYFARNTLKLLYIDSPESGDELRKKSSKIFDFVRYDFKYLDLRKYNLIKKAKNFDFKSFKINNLTKIKFISHKVLFVHLPVAIIFFAFLYLFIPTFYSYEKSEIEKTICKDKKFKCMIKGNINYRFYPTPRINFKDLIIQDISKNKKTFILADKAAIKLSIKNLLAKEKQKYQKLQLSKFEINFQIEDYKNYKNFFNGDKKLLPIILDSGKIIFFDKNDYVAIINNVNIKFSSSQDLSKAILKGNFLNDSLVLEYVKKKEEEKILTDLVIKMSSLNLLAKLNNL